MMKFIEKISQNIFVAGHWKDNFKNIPKTQILGKKSFLLPLKNFYSINHSIELRQVAKWKKIFKFSKIYIYTLKYIKICKIIYVYVYILLQNSINQQRNR